METLEFGLGLEAFQKGDSKTANPYTEGTTEFTDWVRGWEYGEKKS